MAGKLQWIFNNIMWIIIRSYLHGVEINQIKETLAPHDWQGKGGL